MIVLLDENLPKKLRLYLKGFQVFTLQQKEWLGKSNGSLLKLMIEANINVLITFDKNIQHQQNYSTYPITVLILVAQNNTIACLEPLAPKIISTLNSNPPTGAIIIS